MKKVNVGLVGFGTVGKGVVKTLLSKKKILEERSGVSVNLARIADKDLRSRKGVRVPKRLLTKDVNSVIKDRNIDIIVELIGGIHPAKEIILKSLALGKHVVTANKALLAEHGKEIFTAASRFRSHLGFEASVGGGIPIIDVLRRDLVSNKIDLIYGILNGTSNFILSKMSEENCTFREALSEAKTKGIAEKNPRLDISGVDSCHKLAILALLGFGLSVKPKDIHVEGIDRIDAMDIQYAKKWGYAVKLLAIAKKAGKELDLRVHPTLIYLRKILASVKDENNAIFVRGDMVGATLFYGRGAGSFPAASSVVGDIIEIAKRIDDFKKPKSAFKMEFDSGVRKVRKINDLSTRYYMRFSAIDRPGVLSSVSSILAQNKISIATVTQKERKKGQSVPIVMLTHEANEGKMNRALKKIDKLPFITKKTVKIRIER
ncbi:MAG: homoserine dehydrogenase [Candidatus Omnitrophica bacterium]|nr:homoserine dehydrogenase [Candidatus Omnitrophota bacterium]